VHVPKTIDNDYRGIDFTFGFFTAVDVMAGELLNLRADAIATSSYFIVETMGRKAGWLAYGVAISGEAHMVVGVEDVVGALATEETVTDPHTGAPKASTRLSMEHLVDLVVDLIVTRERRGKLYGTIVLAEGLAEMLPEAYLRDVARDEHAFDVVLGSQLGLGAFRALAEEGLDGHMVSVSGQLVLRYVPFGQIIDPVTLRTDVRFIPRGSDFHRLAMELGTHVPSIEAGQ
jgi:6-phosphofructokinase